MNPRTPSRLARLVFATAGCAAFVESKIRRGFVKPVAVECADCGRLIPAKLWRPEFGMCGPCHHYRIAELRARLLARLAAGGDLS